jgi:hypothetical protein
MCDGTAETATILRNAFAKVRKNIQFEPRCKVGKKVFQFPEINGLEHNSLSTFMRIGGITIFVCISASA